MLKGQTFKGKNSGETHCGRGNIGGTNGRGTRGYGAKKGKYWRENMVKGRMRGVHILEG